MLGIGYWVLGIGFGGGVLSIVATHFVAFCGKISCLPGSLRIDCAYQVHGVSRNTSRVSPREVPLWS